MPIGVAATDVGFVVFAEEAVLVVRPVGSGATLGAAGGLIGAAVGAGIDALMEHGREHEECSPFPPFREMEMVRDGIVRQLPHSLTAEQNWPSVGPGKEVTVIARHLIISLRVSIWTGLTLRVKGPEEPETVRIRVSPFHVSRVRRAMHEAGYAASS